MKNIFNKVALQGLRKNRTRTVVTIIGVILSVAMITAVTTFIASLQKNLIDGQIAKSGDWQVQFINVDSTSAEKIANNNEVKSASLQQNIGYASLDGATNPIKPYIFIAGFNNAAFNAMPINLTNGRLPQNSSEIIIPEHLLENGDARLHVGDALTLSVGSRMYNGTKLGQGNSYIGDIDNHADSDMPSEIFTPEFTKSYTVVGIFKKPGFEEAFSPGYTAITAAGSQTADSQGTFDVFVTLKSPHEVYAFAETMSGAEEYTFNRALLRYYGVSTNDNFNAVLYSLGAILIALILIGSILLIYNSFAISVSERSRQFGILSSVGATKKQLIKSVLFEGICIGAIGIPLGLIAGICGIGLTLKLIGGLTKSILSTEFQADAHLSLVLSWIALIIAAFVGIITILIAAYIPAKRAMKKGVIDVIRQSDDIKINIRAVKTSKLISLMFGLEGTLAHKNFKRNKKRYRNTVISLFVSVVLFIAASAFGMYLKQGIEMGVQDVGYDLSLTPSVAGWEIPEDAVLSLYDHLKTAEGVYDGACQNILTCNTKIPKGEFTKRYKKYYTESFSNEGDGVDFGFAIHFLSDDVYNRYLETLGLEKKDYGIKAGKFPAVAKVEGYFGEEQRVVSVDIFNNSSLALDFGVGYREGLFDTPTKKVAITISDVWPDGISQKSFGGMLLFAPLSDVPLIGAPTEAFSGITMTFNTNEPMKSTSEMKNILEEYGITSGYTLYNEAEALQQNRNVLLVMNVFTYGFVILISLITIANVFNTISTGINLRRREFAMLRSVGLNNRGFNKMMSFECLFFGLKALLYGLPVSAGITYLIYRAVLRGVDVSFQLPWSSIGVSVFSVFFVVFVTMMYAVSKVKKANVIDALRMD